MLPAFLLRACIDWIRHNPALASSNPYSRCEEAVKIIPSLWQKEVGWGDPNILVLATVAAYWQEFFHVEDPLEDEKEWREGLIKHSSHYDSFEDWQAWFKKEYAEIYNDNNIWNCILLSAWAHTHQYDLSCAKTSWRFTPSRSYLPTSQMWRLKPHINLISSVLREIWEEELTAYKKAQFIVKEVPTIFPERVESLGFDSKKYVFNWPAEINLAPETLAVDEMIADIVLPSSDTWYRHLDSVIFADNCVDITALTNRSRYVFGSHRRFLELCVTLGEPEAKRQAKAEGWLVE